MTGRGFKVWREERALNQEMAAEAVGVNRKTVGRWEAAWEREIPEEIEGRIKEWDMSHTIELDVPNGTLGMGHGTSDVPMGHGTDGTLGQVDGTSYVPLLEASILEEQGKQIRQMAELMKAMGGQVSEMKEAVDLLRHRVKATEDDIAELKRRPPTMTGALIQEELRSAERRSFPKPKPGEKWKGYGSGR